MPRHLTFLLLAGLVALSACRSKPKKKEAELPIESPRGGHSGKVTVRLGEPGSDGRKGSAGRGKPKPGVPETVPPTPKPFVELKLDPVAKPARTPVPPPLARVPSPAKVVEDANPASATPSAPVQAPSGKPPIQPDASRPATAAEKVKPPSTVNPVSSLTPPTASSPSETLPTPPRTAKPADGSTMELGVPSKPRPPAPEPLRATFPAASAQTKPVTVGPMLGLLGTEPRTRIGDSRNLPLPGGSAGSAHGTSSPPLPLPEGSGTNTPPATNAALKAIGVDPLLQGAAWREQQLARQAAEQKAREEEQQKLKSALYRFLFKGATNR